VPLSKKSEVIHSWHSNHDACLIGGSKDGRKTDLYSSVHEKHSERADFTISCSIAIHFCQPNKNNRKSSAYCHQLLHWIQHLY